MEWIELCPNTYAMNVPGGALIRWTSEGGQSCMCFVSDVCATKTPEGDAYLYYQSNGG